MTRSTDDQSQAPDELKAQFRELAVTLMDNVNEPMVLQRLVQFAVRAVPGADHAAVTVIDRHGRPTTTASTDSVPLEVDALQYEFNQGPCLEALVKHDIVTAEDLASYGQWPLFSSATVERTPVRSMISFRLFITEEERAALNLYAERAAAFGSEAAATGAMFAAYGSMALIAARNRHTVDNLRRALETNREIGVAMGILMARNLLTREQAFDALRTASQHLNVKLAAIAANVADTGELPALRSDRHAGVRRG